MYRKTVLLLLCFVLLLGALPRGIITDGPPKPATRTPMIYSEIQKPSINGIKLKGSKGILWAQIPDTTANGYACQLDSLYPFEADIADDIITEGSGWVIDSVTGYFSNWNGFISWANVPNIHFLVYEDSVLASPHPVDSPFIEVVVPKSNYTATYLAAGVNGVYRVDMELPSPVVLPGGQRFWVEIQPSNVYNVNGQTGTQSQVAIGNVQEMYFRSPLLGYPSWLDATTTWGSALEAGFILYGSSVTITWDFETGLQGWTHTNGLPFPGGWDVESSYTHTPPPSPGDSTLWIDPDAYGGGIGPDTAWSPVFIPDSTLTQWVKYGVEFYGSSGMYTDDLYVGIRTYTGGAWNSPVELKHYVQGSPFNGWDSVDVSAYNTADRMQIYFCYTDNYTWGYWNGVDNISVNGILYVSSHDVGAASIDVPGSVVDPFTTFTPTATFRNFGSNPETFDAYYKIDSAGTNVYLESVNITLNPGDDSTHEFTDYTSGDDGVVYDIYAYTVLPGDENPGNDTTYKQTTVYAVFNTMVSNWTTIPPIIDGIIDPVTEWGGAHVYDISDVFGYGDEGIPDSPGDCILYLMNDSNNLYMAVDYVADVTLDGYDQIGTYFDENNDNAWDTDSTEGNFWFYWDGSVDAIIYRSIPDYTQRLAPGVSYARSLITNQQYEVSIPFGIDTTNFHYLYNTQFPDTFGFYIYALNQNPYNTGGIWPTIAPVWDDPSTYGDLIITEYQAGIEDDDEEIPAVYELSVNNWIASTNGIEIQYSLPEKTDIYIGVYDAMGRMIYSLKRDNVAAGWYNLSVREDIPSGIYFIKMKAGKFEDVKKALILR